MAISIDSVKSRDALPVSARAHPLRVLEDDETDIVTATRSLAAHVGFLNSSKARKHDLRSKYADTTPGRRALRWYLESRAYDKHNIMLYPRLFDLMAYCLIAENAKSDVWQLLHTKHIPAAVTATGAWKGSVLRSLVCSSDGLERRSTRL